MSSWTRKKKNWLLLGAFILCVLIYTVFGRPERISDKRLDLFWSYKEAFINNNKIIGREIVLNYFLFVPIGFMSSFAIESKKHNTYRVLLSISIGFITSTLIELGQYYMFRGTAEYDDIFNNTLGALLGSLLFLFLYKIGNKKIDDIDNACRRIGIIFVVVAIIACITADNSSNNVARQLGFQVSNSEIKQDKLFLDGFCFTYGYDIMDTTTKSLKTAWKDSDYNILLKSQKTGAVYTMNTTTNIKNHAVNNYFRSIYEYPMTGFKSSIELKKLDISDEYEVMIKSGRLMLSGETFIKDGKIEKTPEKEKASLDVYGTDLQRIVDNGYLKAHNNFNSCVVYQYGKYLIWILDDNYRFDVDGQTKMTCQIWTTQVEKKPNYGTDNMYLFDDRGFIFEEKEITDKINTGKYRVASIKLSTNYSIAFIIVGAYSDGMWEWQETFRPRY